VKVAHLVLLLVSVSDAAWTICLCIFCFSLMMRFVGKLLFCAKYGFPFLVLSVLVKREGEHPFCVVSV